MDQIRVQLHVFPALSHSRKISAPARRPVPAPMFGVCLGVIEREVWSDHPLPVVLQSSLELSHHLRLLVVQIVVFCGVVVEVEQISVER